MHFTAEILKYRIEPLKGRIERLQKRLAKLNLPLVEVTYGDEIVRYDGGPCPIVYVPVTVNQPQVAKLAGWSFAAKIEHSYEDSGVPMNLIVKSPDFGDLPASYRTDKATCDHCNLARLRNDTFVVSHKTEGLKRVGRSCLSDFLGHEGADSILASAEIVAEINSAFTDEDYGGGGSGPAAYHPRVICKHTAAIIRVNGWKSRKAVQDTNQSSTSDVLMYLLTSKEDPDPKGIYTPNEQDIAQGVAAYEWVMSIDPETSNEYLYNLRALFGREYVTLDKLSLTCSAVATYQREMARIEEEKIRMSRPSVHVGKVGDKIGTGKGKQIAPFTVNVLRRHGVEGFYGLTTIVTMQDDTGNEYVWFKSGSLDDEIVAGSRVVVNGGAIKEHRLDKNTDRPVTVLTRTVLIPEESN